MEEKRKTIWERVEPYLYRVTRPVCATEWSVSYYVKFQDWKGVMRTVPAGKNLKAARKKKELLLADNLREVDFDKDKVKGMTFAQWGKIYLERYASKKRSSREDARHVQTLSGFFGNLLLSQITRAKVEEFKKIRKERQTWRGQPVSDAYCNRELACLRHLLKLALEEGIIETAPIVRLYKESNARERALSAEEYQRLLAVSPLHLQRIIVCAYETAMRAGEIKGLTWDKVDLKTGFIRLAATDTKTNEKRAIPVSLVLQGILEEIRKEQREGKVTPIGGHVFTWGGRAMSEGWKRAWATACQKAGLADLRFHDLRHTFVTRKVREGQDYKRIMAITGHKTFAVFQRYNNPSEEDLKDVVLADSLPPMVQKKAR